MMHLSSFHRDIRPKCPIILKTVKTLDQTAPLEAVLEEQSDPVCIFLQRPVCPQDIDVKCRNKIRGPNCPRTPFSHSLSTA